MSSMTIDSCDGDAEVPGARLSAATVAASAPRITCEPRLKPLSPGPGTQPRQDVEEELVALLRLRVEVEQAADRGRRLLGTVDGAELEARQPQPGLGGGGGAEGGSLEGRLGGGVAGGAAVDGG